VKGLTVKRFSRFLCAVVTALLVLGHSGSANAKLVTTMVTKPITQTLVFTGYDLKIVSIQTVATLDNRPMLSKMNDCSTPYVMVVVSLQNASSTQELNTPALTFNFELADGSNLTGPQGDGVFLYPSLGRAPDTFHPKDHKSIIYLTCNWNGQAITKLFLTNNGSSGDTGYANVRFLMPPGFVKAVDPMGTPPP
jgi:hypothetical protein